jgi:hypothetical protein
MLPSPRERGDHAAEADRGTSALCPDGRLLSLVRRDIRPNQERQLRQQVRFIKATDGVRLALAESGLGPTLVKAANWLTHLEYEWQSPVWRHWIQFFSAHSIDVRVTVDPVHWFLGDANDVRSNSYLEDCATEFQVQALELDWVCVSWDADLRQAGSGWSHHDFRGSKWQNIKNQENQSYLKNAYRVLLTRARQGMVIFVPPGDRTDHTRLPEYYDQTFGYLVQLGLPSI